jgi:CheY-like chemotaxis protein
MNNYSVPVTKPAVRILLIEDNDISRQLMCDYLEFYGWEVHSLARGAECFAAIAHFRPHLILLDLKLPDADGYTILEQIQSDPNTQQIPIVVISAFAFPADQQRALSLGVQRYLIKPVKPALLKQVIEQELAKGQVEDF